MRVRAGYLVAAAGAAYTAFRHVVQGTPVIGLPIQRAEALGPAVRWMGYYVWHMASAAVVLMALGFLWAALRPEARPVGLFLTVLAAAFAGLALWITLSAGFALQKVFPLRAFTVIALGGGFSSVRR